MTTSELTRLASCTAQLLEATASAESFYIETVKKDATYQVDFFGKVKPFADKVQPLAAEWHPLAAAFVRERQFRDLHVQQIEQTVENLDVVAIKSFYPSSGMKRQRETFKAVRYVLTIVLEELEH
ncbi:YppE family protein [Shouchella shacheensis]|uniref:YppE family protein n=1 Tax=Shouchella shacheensis TaxID=1649580 RepID=UPI00074003A8|nr:YppE family protein [Shouchella shacheensis]